MFEVIVKVVTLFVGLFTAPVQFEKTEPVPAAAVSV